MIELQHAYTRSYFPDCFSNLLVVLKKKSKA